MEYEVDVGLEVDDTANFVRELAEAYLFSDPDIVGESAHLMHETGNIQVEVRAGDVAVRYDQEFGGSWERKMELGLLDFYNNEDSWFDLDGMAEPDTEDDLYDDFEVGSEYVLDWEDNSHL